MTINDDRQVKPNDGRHEDKQLRNKNQHGRGYLALGRKHESDGGDDASPDKSAHGDEFFDDCHDWERLDRQYAQRGPQRRKNRNERLDGEFDDSLAVHSVDVSESTSLRGLQALRHPKNR